MLTLPYILPTLLAFFTLAGCGGDQSGFVMAAEAETGAETDSLPCITHTECATNCCMPVVRPFPAIQTMCSPDGQYCIDNGQCTDTCPNKNDQECDDGGPGSEYSLCVLGTDCADCGPRYP